MARFQVAIGSFSAFHAIEEIANVLDGKVAVHRLSLGRLNLRFGILELPASRRHDFERLALRAAAEIAKRASKLDFPFNQGRAAVSLILSEYKQRTGWQFEDYLHRVGNSPVVVNRKSSAVR